MRGTLRVLAVAAAGTAALLAVGLVWAHATLIRSDPPADARLAAPPGKIDLWFTEPLERSFSKAEIYAPDGSVLEGTAVRFDNADPTHMVLEVDDVLESGYYTVLWETVSQTDGHEWRGNFTFVVLNPDGSEPAAGATLNLPSGGTSLPSVGAVIARWLALGGAVALVGSIGFALLVARPVLAAAPTDLSRRALGRLVLQIGVLATMAALIGGIVQLGLDLQRLGGLAVADRYLFETRGGGFWLARQALLLAAGGALLSSWSTRSRPAGHARWLAASGVIGFGVLLTFSFTSHAATGPGRAWAVAADAVHLGAAAFWLGGLPSLALFLPWLLRHARKGPALPGIVGRFSVAAAFSVFVLAATGIFSAFVQVPSWSALVDSDYGRTLLVKLALLAPILAVAAANNRLVARKKTVRLSTLLRAEAALGAVLLVSVAVLVQAPTTRQTATAAAPAGPPSTVQLSGESGDLIVHFLVTPVRVGPNTIQVHLAPRTDQPVGDVQGVRLRLTHPELGLTTHELTAAGGNLYTGRDIYLGQPGSWNAEVDIRRSGVDDIRTSFDLAVEAAQATSGERGLFANPMPRFREEAVLGWVLVAVGAAPLIWRRRLRGRWPAGGRVALGAGTFAVLAGVVLLFSTGHVHAPLPGGGSGPQDPEAVVRGRVLYEQNCMRCHGVNGTGDGPDAAGLSPPPADLRQHIPMHNDDYFFTLISKGRRGTAMPPFEDVLTEQERRSIIAFLRDEFDN